MIDGKIVPTPKRRERRKAQGKNFQPIHGSRWPYKRSVALTKRLEQVSKIEDRTARLQAIALLPVLRSRGHGGKHRAWQRTVMGRHMADRSKY